MYCTRFPASKQAQIHPNRNHLPILTKMKHHFSPVWDISTSKRSFHSTLHAKRCTRVSQRRNKPRYTQIVIICRFWRKLSVVSLPFQIFRRLNAVFTALCMQKRGTRVFQRLSKPRHTQIAVISRFWRKLNVVSLRFQIFRRLNALFTALCVRNVVHAFSSVETSLDTRKSLSFANFVENQAIFLCRLSEFVV